MTFSRNIAAAAVAISAAALGIGAAAIPASAATPACSGAASGTCGSQINVSGNAMNVKGNRAVVGSKIIAFLNSAVNTGGDLNAVQTTTNPNERTFEFAPGSKLSGMCVSEPSVTAGSMLELRPCRAPSSSLAKFQEFTGVNLENTSGTQWKNVASGLTVQAVGTGNALRAVKTVTNLGGSFWGFNATAVIPPAN